MTKSLALVGTALVSSAAGVLTYASGVWSGQFLSLRSWGTICAGKTVDPAHPNGSPGWLPLSNACRWSDGTSRELVPSYVNPLTLVFALLTATCLVLAVRAAVRTEALPRDRLTPAGGEGRQQA